MNFWVQKVFYNTLRGNTTLELKKKSFFWLKQCFNTIKTICTGFYSKTFFLKDSAKDFPERLGALAERDQSL